MQSLRPYQLEAVDFLVRNGRAILAYPPGTGKTAIIARSLVKPPEKSALANDAVGKRLLVVAPNGPVLQHWHDELLRWSKIHGVVGTGTAKKRTDWRHFSYGGALILNYECMRQDIDDLLKIEWDAVVFDESHRLKNRKSLTFKAAGKLARRTPKLALVTGTPILNSADELWTSLHMLEPTKYRSFWRWAEYHFHIVEARHRGRLVREVGALQDGHAELLRAEVRKVLIQKPIELLLPDLPAVTETYLSVCLAPAERRMHDSMNEKFWMEHGGELVIAPNKISQSLRLRQLASDWTAFGADELGTKGKAAVNLIEDFDGEQVVVFCAFRATVDALHRALPGISVAIHGGMSTDLRNHSMHLFISGKKQVLIGTISTMGEGIDGLQIARNAIFIDRDWTPARNEQAIARLRRSGQESAVNVIHLVAQDSMDDVIAAALRRKESVVDAVMGCRTRSA